MPKQGKEGMESREGGKKRGRKLIISRRSFSENMPGSNVLFLFTVAKSVSETLERATREGRKQDAVAMRGKEKAQVKEKIMRRRRSLSTPLSQFFLTDNRDDPPEVHLLLLLLERDAAAHGAAGPGGGRRGGGGRGAAQGRGGRASEGLHFFLLSEVAGGKKGKKFCFAFRPWGG